MSTAIVLDACFGSEYLTGEDAFREAIIFDMEQYDEFSNIIISGDMEPVSGTYRAHIKCEYNDGYQVQPSAEDLIRFLYEIFPHENDVFLESFVLYPVKFV